MKILIYTIAVSILGFNACFLSKNPKQEKESIEKADTIRSEHHINLRSLSSFNNDTIAYLQNNFLKNKDFFEGKTLNVLLDSLDLDVKTYFIGDNFNQPDSSKGMILYFVDMYTMFVDKKKKVYKEISVNFVNQVPFDEAFKLMRKNNSKWNEEAYLFHKDRVIESIGMVNKIK